MSHEHETIAALALAEKYLSIHGKFYEPINKHDELGAETRYAALVVARFLAKVKGGAA